MAEPLDIGTIKHFLNFISDGFGMVEIDEPFGFDGANFVVEQRDGEYGRDVSFSGQEVSFTFVNQVNILGHQFDRLIDYNVKYGYEAEVQYILKEGDITHVMGNIDFVTADTDQTHEFSCKVIQETQQAMIKRRLDTSVNLFGTEDMSGNTITPVATSNILLKAIPISVRSKWRALLPFWDETSLLTATVHRLRQNPIKDIEESEIENTLSSNFETSTLVTSLTDNDYYNKLYNFGYIDAIEDINNAKVTFSDIEISYFIGTLANIEDNWDNANRRFLYRVTTLPIGLDNYTASDVEAEYLDEIPYTASFIGNESIDRFGNFEGTRDRYDLTFETVEFIIPEIPRGHRACIIFDVGRQGTITEWLSGNILIEGQSVSLDSVTKGVRLVDAMSQVIKNINQDYSINAPRFENGGEWYDNFIFSGNLIRGFDDKPFVVKLKDIQQSLLEFNSDFEINGNVVSFIKYDDFYTDNEMASFLIAPNSVFRSSYNDRYAINEFYFKYKNFNQDKDDINSSESVHTEVELLIRNKQVENQKEIEIPFIRDQSLTETTRLKAIRDKTTTSLSQDDKIFIMDSIPLALGERKTYPVLLSFNILTEANHLQLLNDGNFNWTLLGFNIGDDFIIQNTDNAGSYEVISFTFTIITLSPKGSVSLTAISGKRVTIINYPLTNVDYTVRTNEGFTQITGTRISENYPNLLYTPKRNILNNWGAYLKTSSLYNNKEIQTRYYKNTGNLSTQVTGGPLITENANIQQSELKEAILDPKITNTQVITDFSTFMQLSNDTKTIKGYISVLDNLGAKKQLFPQKLEFNWEENLLDITGEEKYQSPFVTITKDINQDYVITQPGYDTITIDEFDYKVKDDKIRFFDKNTVPLTRDIRYDLVKINGGTFENIVNLVTAIEEL